ncbi:Uncharacterized conserved protein, DUF1697 family [Fictibacillus solisalsi]|uniref:Uncharacterized conserved protein, DUF1697 family n=1 Tax=Fictibacillus solisalsi TaxID=459525 RepID=A0A1G9YAU7_9BACL|nr:DUF1697 domain-containing protein [Fictibacillus solisalsi]SDN06182.1 Uncharacterized conserved protein, DUF1697 family [Fictibacillus solisalsi]
MVYAALLRGINVGGKNKIDMKLLKKTFERIGMSSVVTYINSGNIIFTVSGQSKTTLSHLLEETIHTDFGLQIKVLVRSLDDFKKVIQSLPETWKNDQQMRSDVLFLWDEMDNESVLNHLVINPQIDTVKYVPGAILWSVEKKNITKSGMTKLVGSKPYRHITVRNVNTTRKIYELMEVTETSMTDPSHET